MHGPGITCCVRWEIRPIGIGEIADVVPPGTVVPLGTITKNTDPGLGHTWRTSGY